MAVDGKPPFPKWLFLREPPLARRACAQETIRQTYMEDAMISSVTSQTAPMPPQGGMDMAKMQQKFEAKFTAEFGEEALESIKNEDGTINVEKLDAFLAANGIEKPSAPPPPPPETGMFGDEDGGVDTASLLEKVAADFGDEAAESIQNADGSIDFEKLKELLDEKMAERRASEKDSSFMASLYSGDETLMNAYA